MGCGGEDYSNVGEAGAMPVVPGLHASSHEDDGDDEINVEGLTGELADQQSPLPHTFGGGRHTASILALINLKISDATIDDEDDPREPKAHKATHQNTGTDELSVVALSGLLADDQHVLDAEVLLVAAALVHAARHQNGGADEISLAGLDGEPADLATHKLVEAANAVLGHVIVETGSDIDVDGDGKLTLGAHASRHENAGNDEISVAGLSGELADDQPPKAHKGDHENTGGDEISVAALSGLLADDQHVLDAEVVAVAIAKALLTEQGDILYASGVATPAALAHGTSGQALLTQGDGSNPAWGAPAPAGHKASHASGGADKLKYTRQLLWYLPDDTLETGANQSATIVYRGPDLTLVRWDAQCVTAPTNADLILDVLLGGTSLWASTPADRPTIAATATSGTDTDFDTATITDGDVLTFDIDQIGSGTAGGQVTLILEGTCNLEAD